MTEKAADEAITSIQLTVRLRDRLKEMGKKGDTYEDIIWKLIEDNNYKK